MRTPIENVGWRGCHNVIAHAGGKGTEASITVMEVDHLPSRFLVATLEGPKIGVTERDDLLVQRQVAGPPQEIYSGRLDDTQAHERYDPADCDSKTNLGSVRMSNK